MSEEEAPRWEPGTIRICPMRDGPCPHGLDCPYVGDGYSGYPCKDGWRNYRATKTPAPQTGSPEDARRSSPAQAAKALEWRYDNPQFQTAHTSVRIVYGITEYTGMDKPFMLSSEALPEAVHFATEAEARAAAQSDYETRIRSALAPSDAMPVAWTGSGSMNALALGATGHIWPSKEDAHPIPLFAHPAPSVPPPLQGEVVINDPSEIHAANIQRDLAIDRAEAAEAKVTAQAAERDDYRESWKECMDQRAAAEAALASAKAEVERLDSRADRLHRALVDAEVAAETSKGYPTDLSRKIAALRAAALLEPSEEPK